MSFEKKPITEIVDFNPKRAIKKGSVAPFIDMAALPVSSRDVDEITEKEFKSGGAKFCNGDTLFARITPCLENGKTAKVSGLDKNQNGFGSTEFIVMSAKDQEHDEDYVYYLARLPEFRAYAKARMEGTSGRQRVPWQSLAEFEYPLPSKEQRKLAGNFFRAIDDKISLNTQTNQTLEQMAQAIFKSWFVDFDPVKAKINGEQPEGMDAATASLFPEKLVESELGLIPEGWEIHNTQDLFEVKDGTHDSPKKAEEGHYLVTSKHITKGKIDTSSAYLISDADFDKVNQRSKVDTFDILLTMIGTVGEVVVVYDNPVEFAIKNVGLFKTSQRPELVWLFYWHLQSFKMKHYLEVRMAGTTQQYLTLKTLRTIPVVLPSNELLAKFNEVMSPLMEKISDNHNQNQTLSNLRDTLLPKLLSGEIELGETEEMAEVN